MKQKNTSKYRQDKARNNSDVRTRAVLWCFRINCNKSCFVVKFFAKVGIEFFKTRGIYINSRSIGGGLRMPHLNGIFIHENATLGKNCAILQQVTIGANEHKLDYKKAPQLGNRVYIGAGAKIIGGLTIGDDVRIGANAVVTKNVPAGMTVVGFNKIIETKKERDGII